jgi:hypothetical protein
MENFTLDHDIKVLCVTAKSFPEGIMETHQNLHALVPYSNERRYFGMSCPNEKGVIIYKTAAEELYQNEAELFGCETLVIKSGQYITISIKDYVKDLSSIGKAFQILLSQQNLDPDGYCVEWYLKNKEVMCMIRLKSS